MLSKSCIDSEAFQTLESDLNKLRYENLKLQKELKKSQENLALRGQGQNNTSSGFALPSEFKSNWDYLIKDLLAVVFMDFVNAPLIYVNLVQELFLTIEDYVIEQICFKTKSIMKLLNIEEVNYNTIYSRISPIFQENHANIFKLEETDYDKIKNLYSKSFARIFSSADSQDEIDYSQQTKDLLSSDDFPKLISTYQSLSLIMQLSDPKLFLNLKRFDERDFLYVFFRKNEFICIDGFAKEKALSLIILPPVMKGKFAYNGIKPAVLIINKEAEKEEMRVIARKEEESFIVKGGSKTEITDRVDVRNGVGERGSKFLEDEGKEREEGKKNSIISFTERPNYNGEGDNMRKKMGNSPKNIISLDSADQNEQKSFKNDKSTDESQLKNSMKKKAWSPSDFKQKLKENFSLFLNNKNLLKEALQNKKSFLNETTLPPNHNKSTINEDSNALNNNSDLSSSFSFENQILPSKDSPSFNSKNKRKSCDFNPLRRKNEINHDLPRNSESILKISMNSQNNCSINPYLSNADRHSLKPNDKSKPNHKLNINKTITSLKASIDLLKKSKIASTSKEREEKITFPEKSKIIPPTEKTQISEKRKSFIDEFKPRSLNSIKPPTTENLKSDTFFVNVDKTGRNESWKKNEKCEKELKIMGKKDFYHIPNNWRKNFEFIDESIRRKKENFQRSISVRRTMNCLLDSFSSEEEKGVEKGSLTQIYRDFKKHR